MKKLLSILVFCFLFSGSAYSGEIVLECKFDQGKTIWREGKIETYNKSNSTINDKTLRINVQKKEIFLFMDDVSPLKKDEVSWGDKEIKWFFEDENTYTDTVLNRYTGSLIQILGFKNNSKRSSRTHKFICEKISKKF